MDASTLKEYLKCPVCWFIPRSKIFVCSNSHKICESCFAKIQTTVNTNSKPCPTCRCHYDDPPHRNLDLESIVEKSNVELSCTRPRCQVEMTKDKLLEHEDECEFRTVPCPDTACKKKIFFKQLDAHIKIVHPELLVRYEIYEVKFTTKLKPVPNIDCYLEALENNKVQFYPQCVKRNGVWYVWVKIKGGPSLASQWKFSAKTENENTGYSMEFTGSVHPVDLEMDQVMETDDFLRISNKNVVKLGNAGRFVIKMKVFK
eukprot:GFUD01020903.1.p1 GENE.GFUD01020903.1~~GFUD01020903.1.p1  ORF type:complete len:259 (+),score=43.69 GFUD01020903.1:77-853(+)